MPKRTDNPGPSPRLLEFVEENNGSLSATRLAFLLWAVGVLVVWSIDSVRSGSPADLKESVVTILGILMTGKVIQKFGEATSGDNAGSNAAGTDKSTEKISDHS